MTDSEQNTALLGLTVQIVSAHAKNNQVPTQELPALIEQIYSALSRAGAEPVVAEKQLPVVPAKRSVFPDYIICLEDGRKLKTLKRHLRSTFNMTPEQYREKWDLAPDYPMVAPNYAEHRSALAKQLGLGRKPASAAMQAPAASSREPATRDNHAKEAYAKDSGPTGSADSAPAETSRRDMPGREATGREAAGREAAGREAAGREAAGREAVGRDAGGRQHSAREVKEARDMKLRDSKEHDLKDREPKRSEHTAASVFSKFPKGQVEETPEPSPEAPKKRGRKPFSKQMARSMRS